MPDDAKLGSVGVATETNLDHLLHGPRDFTFHPEAVFPGLVNTFSGENGFLD